MSSLEGKMSDNRNTGAAPSFGEAFGVWLKIGLLSSPPDALLHHLRRHPR